jgi:hypothetical protein
MINPSFTSLQIQPHPIKVIQTRKVTVQSLQGGATCKIYHSRKSAKPRPIIQPSSGPRGYQHDRSPMSCPFQNEKRKENVSILNITPLIYPTHAVFYFCCSTSSIVLLRSFSKRVRFWAPQSWAKRCCSSRSRRTVGVRRPCKQGHPCCCRQPECS